MKTIPCRVTWGEFQSIQGLARDCRWPDHFDEERWEAGLRGILGDCRVDAMKRLAAEEPTEFAIQAVEKIPREFRAFISPGGNQEMTDDEPDDR